MPEETAFRAAKGNDWNHQFAVKFEVAKECGVSSRSRMPVAADGLSIVVRHKAAFHLYAAIGAGMCVFHGAFG